MKRKLVLRWAGLVAAAVFLITQVGCDKKTAKEEEGSPAVEESVDVSNEEYVAVHALSSYPMFVDNDHVALKQFGEEYGVKVTIAGPEEWDMDAFARTIEEVAARKPTGMIVYGFSPALKSAIDHAVDMGIPVVCADADVPDSKRLAFVGTNWYEVGRTHAREMARLTGGKGKVAVIMIIGMDIFQEALRGYKEEIAKYPDMKLVDVFDDQASVENVTKITSEILTTYPYIAGISGFDGASPGIGAAIKESGKTGQIKVTAQDVDPPQVKHLEDGVFQVLVGQKRKLFSYYSAKFLYDYIHSPIEISVNDKGAGISNIPVRVDTGLFLVTPENVKAFKGEE